jgi:hypothetical protein
MERLTFLGVIVGSLLAAPLAAEAQQAGKVWRIGCLSPAADRNNPIEDAFYRSMQARARPCQGLPGHRGRHPGHGRAHAGARRRGAVFDRALIPRFEWLRHSAPPDLATPPIFHGVRLPVSPGAGSARAPACHPPQRAGGRAGRPGPGAAGAPPGGGRPGRTCSRAATRA